MLVSAYADSQPWLFLKMASDNTDNHGAITMAGAVSGRRAMNGAIRPKPTTKTPPHTWEAHYMAIANANEVLKAIDKMEMTDKLERRKGEALICRAYAHFVLVNVFCQHYDPAHPDDLGIPYMEKARRNSIPNTSAEPSPRSTPRSRRDIEEDCR